MELNKLASVLFLIVAHFSVSHAQVGTACETPDGFPGICRGFNQCDGLARLLQTRGQDPVVLNYLQNSICGFAGRDPLVCCPRPQTTPPPPEPTTVVTTPPPPEPTPVVTTPPPVTNRYTLPRAPDCGFSNSSNKRIVGGRDADLGEFPWQVALGYRNANNPRIPKWLCGGSLITDKHVLTAAHCVRSNHQLYLVRVGEHDLYSNEDKAHPIDVPVEKVKVHEEFNVSTVTSDIAIITLSQPVSGPMIKPVCLPLDEQLRSQNFFRYTPVISGWGSTFFKGPSSAILQTVQIPVVSNEACKQSYKAFRNVIIDDRVLCAGYVAGKKDSCEGDSGGPMVYGQGKLDDHLTYYQIGVVSYGFRCAEPGYPGVYTRVTHFLDWIQKNLD